MGGGLLRDPLKILRVRKLEKLSGKKDFSLVRVSSIEPPPNAKRRSLLFLHHVYTELYHIGDSWKPAPREAPG